MAGRTGGPSDPRRPFWTKHRFPPRRTFSTSLTRAPASCRRGIAPLCLAREPHAVSLERFFWSRSAQEAHQALIHLPRKHRRQPASARCTRLSASEGRRPGPAAQQPPSTSSLPLFLLLQAPPAPLQTPPSRKLSAKASTSSPFAECLVDSGEIPGCAER